MRIENLELEMTLVKQSTILSNEGTCLILTSFAKTLSFTKYKSSSMCFVLAYRTGLAVRADVL